MDAVIEWHEQGLVPLGPELAGDPRCRFVHGDFFALAAASCEGFDPGGAKAEVPRRLARRRSFTAQPPTRPPRRFLRTCRATRACLSTSPRRCFRSLGPMIRRRRLSWPRWAMCSTLLTHMSSCSPIRFSNVIQPYSVYGPDPLKMRGVQPGPFVSRRVTKGAYKVHKTAVFVILPR